jgi:hypothetical protein
MWPFENRRVSSKSYKALALTLYTRLIDGARPPNTEELFGRQLNEAYLNKWREGVRAAALFSLADSAKRSSKGNNIVDSPT